MVVALEKRSTYLKRTMGRGRVELKKIENPTNRQVTFSKRRMGLLKKASELAILCDAQIGVIIFSGSGKMYEYSSPPWRIANIFDRYLKAPSTRFEEMDIQQKIIREMTRMKDERNRLQIITSQYMGEDLTLLSLQDVSNLEQQLEFSLYKVRLRKQELLDQQLLEMRNREMHVSEVQSDHLCLMTQSAEMVVNQKPFPWWDVGAASSSCTAMKPSASTAALQLLPQLGEYKLQPLQPNLQDGSLQNYIHRLW
ncbi:hypothetical protein EJB05_39306, partial [Eragrostis curvula]